MALFTMRDSWNVWRRKVNEAIGGAVEPVKSEDVTYDNTTSGLTATNVQSAIDEVVGDIGDLDGADIGYDGTTSGLSATNVQSAIDEVDGAVDTLKAKGFKTTSLFEGDASTQKTVTDVDLTAYDALMLYYNNGACSAIVPVSFLTLKNGYIGVEHTTETATYTATFHRLTNTSFTVDASQGSTVFVYGINFNA